MAIKKKESFKGKFINPAAQFVLQGVWRPVRPLHTISVELFQSLSLVHSLSVSVKIPLNSGTSFREQEKGHTAYK